MCASVLSKHSTENIVKSVTAGNHSILALSEVHQPAAVFCHDKLLRLLC
nr:MAG TPA: hypothetical protein [Caudoviricetes sp.]